MNTTPTKEQRMTLLAKQFHSMEWGAPVDPWDAMRFLRWTCREGLSHGEFCAARFLLSVWNPGTDWQAMATEEQLPAPEHAARFDMHEALSVWDQGHRAAFARWVADPWWP